MSAREHGKEGGAAKYRALPRSDAPVHDLVVEGYAEIDVRDPATPAQVHHAPDAAGEDVLSAHIGSGCTGAPR